MARKMSREKVAEIAATARAKGERLNLRYERLTNLVLSGLDLRGADMTGALLAGANLTGANLYQANLTGANLLNANLTGAHLGNANMTDTYMGRANLSDAHMMGALLSRTDLYRADLSNADLRGAYLAGSHLSSANLAGAELTGLSLEGLPSGTLTFIPTLMGWSLKIGCWDGTVAELREMIAKNTDWPEAEGEEVAVRRPMLEAAANLCDAYAAARPDALAAMKAAVDRWKDI